MGESDGWSSTERGHGCWNRVFWTCGPSWSSGRGTAPGRMGPLRRAPPPHAAKNSMVIEIHDVLYRRVDCSGDSHHSVEVPGGGLRGTRLGQSGDGGGGL
jgi:hypothetical protein